MFQAGNFKKAIRMPSSVVKERSVSEGSMCLSFTVSVSFCLCPPTVQGGGGG